MDEFVKSYRIAMTDDEYYLYFIDTGGEHTQLGTSSASMTGLADMAKDEGFD